MSAVSAWIDRAPVFVVAAFDIGFLIFIFAALGWALLLLMSAIRWPRDRAYLRSHPDVLFYESGASGRNLDSHLTRAGTGHNCVTVALFRDRLLTGIGALRIFELFGVSQDIPITHIDAFEAKRSLLQGRFVDIHYHDESGSSHRYLLYLRKRDNFTRALGGLLNG